MKQLKVTSPAFKDNGFIPAKYTCDGENVNPPLQIENIPEGTKTLVLIMDDPDAPSCTWDHWIVWNILPESKAFMYIKENSVPGIQGLNSFGKHSYGGPCPPSGTHRYFFKVYALDTELKIELNSRKKGVEEAMEEHILAKGEIIGLYRRL